MSTKVIQTSAREAALRGAHLALGDVRSTSRALRRAEHDRSDPPVAIIVSAFQSIAPAHVRAQAHTLSWLTEAHVQAESTRAVLERRRPDEERTRERMRAAFARFGCSDGRIAARGYELDDCEHTRWQEMEVYRLHESPQGAGALARTRAFERIAGSALERLHDASATPPSDLLHVTCTGYVSPSAAQALVARRGWGETTRVTHVYHMGCYAAFPALRLASALLGSSPPRAGASPRSRVVHTEVCSLHLDPSRHEPEQFVIQSLFADGFVAYDVTDTRVAEPPAVGFELLALLEHTLPDSAAAMTWRCSEWGMQMTLSRDVPERIGAALDPFLSELMLRAGLDRDSASDAYFAVHPGGPRILDRVQDLLQIDDPKLELSRRVLRERGNMSSATVPHVWQAMASDASVRAGAPVISLAFGPGLTICGAVLRKIGP
jgi:predicted naringenin-chalcone synthase